MISETERAVHSLAVPDGKTESAHCCGGVSGGQGSWWVEGATGETAFNGCNDCMEEAPDLQIEGVYLQDRIRYPTRQSFSREQSRFWKFFARGHR